jgi:hypothetical protein
MEGLMVGRATGDVGVVTAGSGFEPEVEKEEPR